MDIERIIDEIEQIEEMFEAPDTRPFSATDISAANRRHDQMLAQSPWFRRWQRYGLCCRNEAEGGPRIQNQCSLSRLETDSHADFPGGSFHLLKSSAFHGALFRQLAQFSTLLNFNSHTGNLPETILRRTAATSFSLRGNSSDRQFAFSVGACAPGCV
jgi:hypothetical protein